MRHLARFCVCLLPQTPVSRWMPPIAWALFLFVLSSIPGDRYPEVRLVQFDKAVHFAMYLPLGLALGRALGERRDGGSVLTVRRAWAGVALGAFYGATDEVHQLFVTNRSASVADWVIDFLAVWAGVFLWRWSMRLLFPPGGASVLSAEANRGKSA